MASLEEQVRLDPHKLLKFVLGDQYWPTIRSFHGDEATQIATGMPRILVEERDEQEPPPPSPKHKDLQVPTGTDRSLLDDA